MANAPTAADILRHTSAYHRSILSQHDVRHRLLTSLLRPQASPHPDQTTSKTLLLAAQAIESSVSASSTSSSSSLRLTETTLLSLPRQTPTSSLLLSLIHAATHRPVDAAVCLLDLFALEPSAARSEIAPVVFEDLFVFHLYPALQWFQEQRSRILSKKAPDLRRSRSSVGMGLISTMSGDEAAELKELEAAYEEVVDENTRAFALFLKEVVQGRNGRDGVDQVLPPSLVLDRNGDQSRMNQVTSLGVEDGSIVDDSRHKQGRYNPLWVEEEEEPSSVYLDRPTDGTIGTVGTVGRPPSPSPQRVPLALLSNLPSPTSSSNPYFDKASFSGGSFAEASSSESEGETEVCTSMVTIS